MLNSEQQASAPTPFDLFSKFDDELIGTKVSNDQLRMLYSKEADHDGYSNVGDAIALLQLTLGF